jgi:hypothetical protein
MKTYTRDQLIKAIELAKTYKPSKIEGNFSASGLYQIDDILELFDKKYFKQVTNGAIDGKLVSKEDIHNEIKKLIDEDSSNKFKTAISFKVNSTETLNKILNDEK